jgi:hypothetical protein
VPTTYHPDEKTAVLVLLERNGGNIQRTATQTGVPERTLRRWHGQILAQLRRYPSHRPHLAENMVVPAFVSDMDALAFIRQNIIAELSRLSSTLQYDPGYSTPYQRTLILSQLMDKLLKLDLHLQPYTQKDDDEILIYEGEDEPLDEKEYERIYGPGLAHTNDYSGRYSPEANESNRRIP